MMCIRVQLLLLALAAAVTSFLPRNAAGAEPDTNQFQQLTVEQAQELARDKSGRLLLDGLKSLSPEVASESSLYRTVLPNTKQSK